VTSPSIKPISPTALLVEFDGSQTDLDLCDLDVYHFTNGLEVLGAILVGVNTVEVHTTPQQPNTIYELEITP
jgi:hypothetical protein